MKANVKTSNLALGIGGVAVALIIVFALVFGVRWLNSATIQHQLITPRKGIECVIVSSTDGAAVACWNALNIK